MTTRVLVAHASKMGATAGIAEAVGDGLRRAGLEVDVRPAGEVGAIDRYDAVVLGSAIYVRRWRPEAVRFLRQNADDLADRRVWLFHSGPVGPDKDEVQTMPGRVERLAHRIGATPAVTFPGRLDPATAKGFLARRLSRTRGLAGDYRDWDQIATWTAGIAAELQGTTAPTDPHPTEQG